MKWLLSLLLFVSVAKADMLENSKVLIIQPFYVDGIYRLQILDDIDFKVSTLTLRDTSMDRYGESQRYAVRNMIERIRKINPPIRVITLGEHIAGVNEEYYSIFAQPDCWCFDLGKEKVPITAEPIRKALSVLHSKKVYMIKDMTEIAERRRQTWTKALAESDLEPEVLEVRNEASLRKTLIDANSKEQGVLLINAFSLPGESGMLSYRQIENMVTKFNHTHLEVGVYRNWHQAALAVGIDPDDIGKNINGNHTPLSVKTSINISRLHELGMMELATGHFKEAFLYEPIEDR